ncbi:unnamed protein product [Sphagnum tenellum]
MMTSLLIKLDSVPESPLGAKVSSGAAHFLAVVSGQCGCLFFPKLPAIGWQCLWCLRAFLDFGDGVEEVGDYFPITMFPIHLRKGRDDGLTREAVTRTSPHPEDEVKGELYDMVISYQAQCGFDS